MLERKVESFSQLYIICYMPVVVLGTDEPLRHGHGSIVAPPGLQTGRLHPGPVHQLLHTGQGVVVIVPPSHGEEPGPGERHQVEVLAGAGPAGAGGDGAGVYVQGLRGPVGGISTVAPGCYFSFIDHFRKIFFF